MITGLRTKIFADCADIEGIRRYLRDPRVSGFTTNPSLMRRAGIEDYRTFCRELVESVPEHPVSLEVFGDDPEEVLRQARLISSWGENVYVKVPVTTSTGEPLAAVARELSEEGVPVNVTALMTTAQVELIASALGNGARSLISVFAGRVADAGVDPVPIMRRSVEVIEELAPKAQLIWASPREVLNLVQANAVGCHVITMTPPLLAKLDCLGKDLDRFSLETVQMFRDDALAAAYDL
jgi:transaldolase